MMCLWAPTRSAAITSRRAFGRRAVSYALPLLFTGSDKARSSDLKTCGPPGQTFVLEELQLPRRPLQVLADVRVGHIDQGPRALADRLAVEVGHPVLRDDVAHVAAGGRHTRARLVHGHDAREFAVLRRAWRRRGAAGRRTGWPHRCPGRRSP